MKKKILAVTAISCVCLLAGCGETPQDVIITQKEQTGMTDYVTKDESDETASLETELLEPQTYQDEVVSEDGKLKVSIDAAVDIPEAERFPVYKVTAKEFTQSFIDTVTETFFQDSPVYDADEYYVMTKAEIAAEIADLEEELASDNIDLEKAERTLGIIDITEEEYKKELQRMIDDWESEYKNAPKTPVKTVVKPEMFSDADGFGKRYVVEVDKEHYYNYVIKDFCGNIIEIKRSNAHSGFRELFWGEYEFLKNNDDGGNGNNIEISESKAETLAGIEMENAKAMADEKLKVLGLDHMELYDWDYGILLASEDGLEVDNQAFQVQDAGYWFFYTRKVNDISVTYTYDVGGGLESMEDERETWYYETVNFLVTDDGIEQVDISSLYDMDEEENSSVQLMKFDEIMEIFKNMMLITNGEYVSNYENMRTYNIDHIQLGYMRIYNPDTDSRSGTLIPVWDFFGGFEGEMITEDENGEYRNYVKHQSYMTINAIDGTVIDRSLGY